MLFLLARIVGRDHRRHIVMLLGGVVGTILVGGVVFAATQSASIGTGLYWSVTTASTVGYGDVTPHNAAGRIVAVAVMLTAIPLLASAFALMTGAAAAAGLRRILDMDSAFPSQGFRLVVGAHDNAPAIIEELLQADESVVWLADVAAEDAPVGVHLVRGDPTERAAILRCQPQNAMQALVTGASDGDVLISAVMLRAHAPEVEITALVKAPSVREALCDLGVRQAISLDDLVAHTLAKTLESPHAGDAVVQLLDSDGIDLREVDAGPDAVGEPLSKARSQAGTLVLGLIRDEVMTLGLDEDPVLRSGDRLLVAARPTLPTAPRKHGR